MSRPPEIPDERLLDLLADQALDGLPDAELAELKGLLADAPGIAPESLAITAAALAMALEPAEVEPLPRFLRTRVEADADRTLSITTPNLRRSGSGNIVAASGWIAAAASWLVTAAALWPGEPEVPRSDLEQIQVGAATIGLKATEHPLAAGARGEMVWNQSAQRGYLKLTGLAGVDPSRGTYQLWIFDERRDPRYPVDGGAFTLDDGGPPTVVPVKPAVSVDRPTLFAITLEPPGGVVVSDRRRILLAGEAPPGEPGR